MRIRKNACKLLGSTSVYANPWPPPPPPSPPACGVTGIVCELNCSPWDVMLIDNLPNFACSSSSSSSSALTNPKGEDAGGGILGNLLKTEVEEPISAIASTAADLTIKATVQMDEKKIKKLERKKSKGKEKAAAETITLCKKNDGKGWHCKRPAQLPHSFCSYHLAQTRSYSSSHRASSTDHASEAATAAETRAEGGDSNNLYYYYDGFGPRRGKRRGRPVISASKMKEEDGRKSMERDDDDDDDDVVAGDDEYDLDCYDEDEDDDDKACYSMPHQDNYKENGRKKKRDGEELEKKRVVKKRGRKPLKSRSLKSLL